MRDFYGKHLWIEILRFLIEKHFTVTWEKKCFSNLIWRRCLRKTINLENWKLFKYLLEAIEKFRSQWDAIRRWMNVVEWTNHNPAGWVLGEQHDSWNLKFAQSITKNVSKSFLVILLFSDYSFPLRLVLLCLEKKVNIYTYTIPLNLYPPLIQCSSFYELWEHAIMLIILRKSFFSLFLASPTSFLLIKNSALAERFTLSLIPRAVMRKEGKFVEEIYSINPSNALLLLRSRAAANVGILKNNLNNIIFKV